MKKNLFYKACLFIIFIVCSCIAHAQSDSIKLDSLKKVLLSQKDDTNKLNTLMKMTHYENNIYDWAQTNQQGLILARKIPSPKSESSILNQLGNYYWNVSNYPLSLNCYLQSMKINEQLHDNENLSANLSNIGNVYLSMGYYRKAIDYSNKSLELEKGTNYESDPFNDATIGKAYSELNILDSAFTFGKIAYDSALAIKDNFYLARATQYLADIYFKNKDYITALDYYNKALARSKLIDFPLGLSSAFQSIAGIYKSRGKTDSSIYYSQQALQIAQQSGATPVTANAAIFLADIYKNNDESKSAFYLRIALAAKDSLYNNERNSEIENIDNDIEQREKDKAAAVLQYQNNLKFYGALAAFALIGIIAIILLRNNKQKIKVNQLLQQQKQKVESTLSELKSTQAQLIQSEKMASLGELTAGIAHEIQNPLNFVNNFSEVNRELLVEMKDEIDKGNMDDAKAIANDVIENSEKINHHGKRADAIVKGMLQHSKASTGKKELTDINKLADEYLRLSYHGLRAKDKSFNATTNTDFDKSIGNINIIPQDIGRVLLNLYNNAFYAVTEKKKQLRENYEPTVSLSTKKMDDKVVLTVKDNGNGITRKIVNKIFQPFFTTKPTGQGTGLGLSLSYDIITKGHGGELKVETKEGEGSEFKILLPIV